MTKNILDVINLKIKELQKNLILLKTASIEINRDNLKTDMIKYWGIERGLHISIECVLDIANILNASLAIEKPDTYRESILALSKEKILPAEFAKQMANMVSFRNILVHDYMKVDEDIMIDIIHNHLNDFTKYIDCINKWINKNYY
jgi:uncharacterized protein YutE (UPF0331/DUF86 family)